MTVLSGDLQGLRHPRPLRRADRRRRRRADRPRVRARRSPTCRASRPSSCSSASAATCASTAPELAARYRDGHGRRGRARPRRRAGRHRDALLPRRLARARRRADVHRLAQPEGLHRRQARRARARSRSAATRGIQDIREPDRGRPLGEAPGGGTVEEVDVYEEFHEARAEFIDPANVKPLKVVVDGGNGMAGPMVGPLLEQLGRRARRDLLDARRQLPRPRAQPAAAREPRSSSCDKVRETGADLGIAWDGDADRCFFIDDTGAVRRRRLPDRDPRRAPAGQEAGRRDILYDVRASRAVRRHRRARRAARAHINRVGHAFFKTRMRDEGAIFGGEVSGHYYFHDFYNADSGTIPALLDAREALGRGPQALRARRRLPLEVLHLRRDQLRGRRRRRRRWPRSRSATRDGEVTQARRRLGRLRRLALQRAPVEHRAAAAAEPRVAGLARGHGAPSATRCSASSAR